MMQKVIAVLLTISATCLMLLLPSFASATSPEPEVEAAQQALAGLGYEPGPADGLAGAATRSALVEFQKKNQLTANGRLNGETQNALFTQWRKIKPKEQPSDDAPATTKPAVASNDDASTEAKQQPESAPASNSTAEESPQPAANTPEAPQTAAVEFEASDDGADDVGNNAPKGKITPGFFFSGGFAQRTGDDLRQHTLGNGNTQSKADNSFDLLLGAGIANREQSWGARVALGYESYSDADSGFNFCIFGCPKEPESTLSTLYLNIMGDYLVTDNISLGAGVNFFLGGYVESDDNTTFRSLDIENSLGISLEAAWNYGSGSFGVRHNQTDLKTETGAGGDSLEHKTTSLFWSYHGYYD